MGMAAALILAGCNTPQKKTADKVMTEQVHQQEPADGAQQIMQRAATAFSSAPGLTPAQKMRLGEIYSQVYLKSMKIRREIGQSKSLMFSRLASVDYDSSEIKKLKARVVKLYQERLDIMFLALAQVQEVVGKGIDVERIYKYFEEKEIPELFHRHIAEQESK